MKTILIFRNFEDYKKESVIFKKFNFFIIIMILIPVFYSFIFSFNSPSNLANKGAILILNSYHPGYAWSDNEQQGILSVILSADTNWLPYIEYLDTKRYPGGEHLKYTAELLRNKYKNQKFSVIISMDDSALEFVLKYKTYIFKGTPVVFCGINNYSPGLLHNRTDVTGIAEALDPAGTIDIMLHLHPSAKEIFILHDYTLTGISLRKEVENLIPSYGNRVKFIFPGRVTIEEIIGSLGRLPKSSLVLSLGFVTDSSGRVFNLSETTKMFCEYSPVPVYASHEERLGFGIVGGKLLSGRKHGIEAAKIAIRVVSGEKLSGIPVVTASSSQYMFDYNIMKRFGIPVSELPAKSILINKPVSFFTANKSLIITSLVIISFLTLVIIFLLTYISQRHNSGIVLKKSEERFRQLIKLAPVPMGLVNNDEKILYINDRFNCVFGYTLGDIPTIKEWMLLAYPDENIRRKASRLWVSVVKRAKQAGNDIEPAEYYVTCKDGTLRIVEISGIMIQDGILVTFIDITERKKTEEALIQSETKYRSLIETTDTGFVVLDENGKVIDANKEYIRLSGHESLQQIIGRKVVEWTAEHDRDRNDEEIRKCFSLGFVRNLEIEYVDSKGSCIPVEINATVVKLSGMIAIFTLCRDNTERKRSEERIRKSLAEKEALVRELYHRTKNNMQVISAMLNIQLTYTPDEKIREVFNSMQNRIQSMALVQQKLYTSKDLSSISLREYIMDLTGLMMKSHNIKSRKISINLKDLEDISVLIDSAIPCGLVMNELISNSLKYAFPGEKNGEIKITLRQNREKNIEIGYSDNGIGVHKGFNFRSDAKMGLKSVFNIIENQMQGKVFFENKNGVSCIINFKDTLYDKRI